MSKKVIGILGGMGPLATADLFQKITLHTVAACDQATQTRTLPTARRRCSTAARTPCRR